MRAIVTFVALLFWLPSAAQRVDTLYVNKELGVYVVFDTDITKVDIASKLEYGFNVDANMLMLRAVKEDSKNTSIMIRTVSEDFVFILCYRKSLEALLLHKGKSQLQKAVKVPAVESVPVSPSPVGNVSQKGAGAGTAVNKSKALAMPKEIQTRAARGNRDATVLDSLMQLKIYTVYEAKKSFRDVGEIGNGLFFSLHNVYVDDKFIYVKVSLYNTSSISFDVDFMYFERLQGKGFKKREAFSNNATPFVYKESVLAVEPSADEVMVYVLNLFAYNEKDNLLVRINEKGGLRSLQFSIPCEKIVNATSL